MENSEQEYNSDSLLNRILIADVFSDAEFVSFREYCTACAITFIDELSPLDYAAFRAQNNLDIEFIKAIRSRVEEILSAHNPDLLATETSSTYGDDRTVVSQVIRSPVEDYWDVAVAIVANEYINIPLNQLKLPARIYHRLMRGGIDTIGKLLLATDELLLEMDQFGSVSLNKIHSISEQLVLSFIANPSFQNNSQLLTNLNDPIAEKNNVTNVTVEQRTLGNNEQTLMNLLLSGASPSNTLNMYSDRNPKLCQRVNMAISEIGLELCQKAYYEPKYVIPIITAFQTYIIWQENIDRIKRLISHIPEIRRNKLLDPYIHLYTQIHKTIDTNELKNIFDGCITISDIDNIIDSLPDHKCRHIAEEFLNWLGFDLSGIIEEVLAKTIKTDRDNLILSKRCDGETLEEISVYFDVTRERIRQIEGQIFNRFRLVNEFSKHFLLLISAELNGAVLFSSDEIIRLIPRSEILLSILRKNPDSNFTYDKHTDCFYLPNVVNISIVDKLLYSLPDMIGESCRETILIQINQQTDIPIKYLEILFIKTFTRIGNMWCKGRVTRAAIYDYILRKHYPNGIRIYDANEIDRFRLYIQEIFGNVQISESDRAIWSRLQSIGILYDRGTYIHPSYVTIPEELLARIEQYFRQSNRIAMAFHELYYKFAEELLLKANIKNRYQLQGVLNYYWGKRYFLNRDYVSIQNDVDIADEIDSFIQARSPISKDELSAVFAGITEAMFMQIIMRLSNIIPLDNSMYMHADHLNLIEDDYKIEEIIDKNITISPVSAKKMLEILSLTHIDFLIRNNIVTHYKLFSVLRFMFRDKFVFTRPYIAPLGTRDVSAQKVLLKLLEGQKRLDVFDLILLCEENHLHFLNSNIMLRSLQDEYIRVDANTLIAIELIDMTDEQCEKIRELISESLQQKGYLSLKTIDNFIFYPDIGLKWTPLLLRSIVERYFSDSFTVIDIPYNDILLMTGIIIDSNNGMIIMNK